MEPILIKIIGELLNLWWTKSQLIVSQWCNMTSKILDTIGWGNDAFWPDGIDPLPEAMLTFHQLDS